MSYLGPYDPCQPRDSERQSRVEYEPLLSKQRLISTSPPRCLTPGHPFVPGLTNPPTRGAAVDRLAKGLSQQTLEASPANRQSHSSPCEPKVDNTCLTDVSSQPGPSIKYPYALELEIDSDVGIADSPPEIILNHTTARQTPTVNYTPLSNNIAVENCSVLESQSTRLPAPSVALAAGSEEDVTRKMKSEARILNMIKKSTQCHVYNAPLPDLDSIVKPSIVSPGEESLPVSKPMMGVIEADTSGISCAALEVDENLDDSDLSWMNSIATLRDAANPGGIKKHGLRYRASHEAALKCSNLVHSRPRMRRRKGHSSKSTTKSISGRIMRDNKGSTTAGLVSGTALKTSEMNISQSNLASLSPLRS